MTQRADDYQLYLSFAKASISDDIASLNSELASVSKWADDNGFTLNISKTQAIVYVSIILNETDLICSPTVKNLGVIFDSTLSWEQHIGKVCGTIYGTLNKLYQIKQFLPTSSRAKIIKTIVFPHVLYSSVLFWSANDLYLTKLAKAVNACTRFVFDIPFIERLGDQRNVLLGMSLRNFLKYRAMIFLFNLIITQTPSYLYSLLKFTNSERYPRNLIIPANHSRVYQCSLFVSGASLWNSLPNNIKLTSSITTFKRLAFEFFKD